MCACTPLKALGLDLQQIIAYLDSHDKIKPQINAPYSQVFNGSGTELLLQRNRPYTLTVTVQRI